MKKYLPSSFSLAITIFAIFIFWAWWGETSFAHPYLKWMGGFEGGAMVFIVLMVIVSFFILIAKISDLCDGYDKWRNRN